MKPLLYIFSMMVISLVFNYAWGAITFLIAIPTSLILKNKGTIFMVAVRMLGYYLWAACLTLYTLIFFYRSDIQIGWLWFYIVIGEIIIYFTFFGGLYQTIKEQRETSTLSFDPDQIRQNNLIQEVSFWSILCSMILFILGLFFPNMVRNPVTLFFVNAIEWVIHLPVIGWIIMFVAFMAFLNYAFMALIGLSFLFFKIKSLFTKRQQEV